ncbi:MAG TPA: 3-oxoacyl-ACP reductase FabG, partial [Acidimicrobiia bacterium]|nr:3-oxoacyl-ACP reductase FabG [Acidimicrobiia bacterium]
MAAPEVFRRAVCAVVDSVGLALDRAGVASSDVAWFVPHQANARIIEVADRSAQHVSGAHSGQHRAPGSAMTTRVALVTGASRGIGRATATALAAAGNRVAFCYSSDDDGAKTTQSEIEQAGGDALALRCDVTDGSAVDATFSTIEDAWGPVALLVNNAGINRDGLVARMTDDDWNDVLRTNLTAAFFTIRRASRPMVKARFGRIVNVSSVSGHMGSPGQVNYSAAKAGLLGVTRAIARELAPRNVTCNVVAPGAIDTAMTAGLDDEWRARAEAAIPLARFGTVDEVAAMIAFLCSDAAGYVTG